MSVGQFFEFLTNLWFQFFKYSRIKESSVVSKALKNWWRFSGGVFDFFNCSEIRSYLLKSVLWMLRMGGSGYIPGLKTSQLHLSVILGMAHKQASHSEPAPTSAPSTGCLLLLSCGWISTELIFGFTLVTNSVRNRSHIGNYYAGRWFIVYTQVSACFYYLPTNICFLCGLLISR
jgi:hypothetical protein